MKRSTEAISAGWDGIVIMVKDLLRAHSVLIIVKSEKANFSAAHHCILSGLFDQRFGIIS